ncbi:MAG: phosphoglucosamine mutase, partial [Brachymonas sp.]|nr:phosphoglucosamine mutase [Brachymonas sp.]
DWKVNPKLAPAQAEIEKQLGSTGRILIRASGTEPVVRVMVEAQDARQARNFAQQLADVISSS